MKLRMPRNATARIVPMMGEAKEKNSTFPDSMSLTHRLDVYEMGLMFNPKGFLVALRQEVVRLKRRSQAGVKVCVVY